MIPPLTPGDLAQIALLALVFSLIETFLARRLAVRLGMVDRGQSRPASGSASRPSPASGGAVPLLGGLAIFAAAALALIPVAGYLTSRPWPALLATATLMALVGLVDDRRPLSPAVKAIAQLVATGVLIVGGTQVHLFDVEVLNVGLTVFWVIGITNAMNLLDNMDGLAGGVAAIACAFLVALAHGPGASPLAAVAVALLGATAGFLFHNFHPARIYMGDAGSLFVGFLLAALAIELRFPANVDWVTWMVPVLILGLPIFDTSVVVWSRLRRRIPVWRAGRDHVSHRLVRKGWSVAKAVLLLYGISAALGVLASIVAHAGAVGAYAVGIAVLCGALLAGWWLERPAWTDGSSSQPSAPRDRPIRRGWNARN